MSGPISKLPLDVVIIVFQQLSLLEERRALARCSQVCRLWYDDAHRTLACRTTIRPMDESETNIVHGGWTEWHGQLMQVPAIPECIIWLSISDNAFLNHAWLESAFACLPRLRHLAICLANPLHHKFHPDSPHPTPFDISLDTLTIRSSALSRLDETVLVVVRCFPKTKFLSVNGVPLKLLGYRVGNSISIPSISLNGLYEWGNDGWYEFLSQPPTARAIRHIHLDLRTLYSICDERTVTLFRNLTNLETLELDLQINPKSWPPDTRIWDRCRNFEKSLEPVLSATIHTFCFRLPEEEKSISEEFSYASLIFIPLLNAMPCTLRHIEIRRGGRSQESKWFLGSASATTRRFAVEGFARCLKRFPELRTVDIIIDWEESDQQILEYRDFLERSFPESISRIGLRFSVPLSSPSPFEHW